MTDKSFTLKKNAVRAARKLLADRKAPAPSFEIKTAAGGGFRIVWDIAPGVDSPPSQTKAAANKAEVGGTRPVDADAEYAAERTQGDAAAGRVASDAVETATPEQGAEHFGIDDNGLEQPSLDRVERLAAETDRATRYRSKSEAQHAAEAQLRSGTAPGVACRIEGGAKNWCIAWLGENPEPAANAPATTRDGTKQEIVIDMLKRPEGASDTEIKSATGWKIVRGFIAGTVKKKLGHTVVSSKEAERGRVYRVIA